MKCRNGTGKLQGGAEQLPAFSQRKDLLHQGFVLLHVEKQHAAGRIRYGTEVIGIKPLIRSLLTGFGKLRQILFFRRSAANEDDFAHALRIFCGKKKGELCAVGMTDYEYLINVVCIR